MVAFTAYVAEGEGFEPSVPVKRTTVFETAPIDHSGNPLNYPLLFQILIAVS